MRYRSFILAVSVLGILTGLAQAQLITSVERRNSGNTAITIAANPLEEESRCFVGSANHTYVSVPDLLLGLEYVQTANEDRENAGYEMDVTFSRAATLYLLLDNRLGKGGVIVREQKPDLVAAGMDWVIDMGFVDTGAGVGSDQYTNGVIDGWYSIYALPVPPGTITLYAQNDGVQRVMYTVAAAPRSMNLAEKPMPIDGETDVLKETLLSWIAGINAATHDVYLGQDFDEVNNASRDLPGTVLIARGHSDTTIDPGALEFGQTYFWRVDEVNAPSNPGIFKGNIWSFTVEPFGYTVTPVAVEASSSYAVMVPENTVNGSGMNDDDQHGTTLEEMWLTESGDTDPWIQFEFENPEKLLEMRIWNCNQLLEFLFRFGVQNATIEISMDGSNWTTLPETPIFAQGPGVEGYEYNTVINFEGRVAKYVKISVIDTYGGPQACLAEVRFISLPTFPRYMDPADGTVLDGLVADLSWRSGRQAASSQILFSSEQAAVEDGSAVLDTTEAVHYEVTGLEYAQTYYWKIIDLNDMAVPPMAAGPLMSLLTPEAGTIDDMEFYAPEAFKEIWDFWVDGYNDSTNGSIVGIDKDGNPGGFYPSRDNYEGAQSMPMAFDNTGAAKSEATRTFAPALDLGVGNPESVGMYFKGFPAGFRENSDGSITMSGIGADIVNDTQEFNFAYKELRGDGSITVRIDDIPHVHDWAKAGVMMRSSLDPSASFAMAIATPQNRTEFMSREITGGPTEGNHTAVQETPLPLWVRLTRKGDLFTAERSVNGNTWVPLTETAEDSRVELLIGDLVYVGLPVTSHEATIPVTVQFSHVSTKGNVSGAWQLEAMSVPQPDNDAASVYLTLTDSSNKSATIEHPDPAATLLTDWTLLRTRIADLNINTSRIESITVGVDGSGFQGEILVDFVHVHADR